MRCGFRRGVSGGDPVRVLHVVGAAWGGVEKVRSEERGRDFCFGAGADRFERGGDIVGRCIGLVGLGFCFEM